MQFDAPIDGALVDEERMMLISWRQWAELVTKSANSVRANGPTSNRPTIGVWVGQDYFDTTLGKKVTARQVTSDSVKWVDGSGSVV